MSEPITPEELIELERIESLATPGPWNWNVNIQGKSMYLEGHRGPQYNEMILGCERWGMHGARFNLFDHKDRIIVPADKFATTYFAREHHKSWFQNLNHPDANLIVAMRTHFPRLLKALREKNNG